MEYYLGKMNLSPETEEMINSTLNSLRNNDNSVTLGMVDIIDLWPFGKIFLASTTAEEVYIEFKGHYHSKTMVQNVTEALSGLIENVSVNTAVLKCTQIDEQHQMPQPLREIRLTADFNAPFSEISQLLSEIMAIPDEELYYFEAKLESTDVKNKIFSGYIEYAIKMVNEEKASIRHRSFLRE